MPENKGKHLTLEDREVVEDGIREGLGCREIAKRLHVAPSTVSREVKAIAQSLGFSDVQISWEQLNRLRKGQAI